MLKIPLRHFSLQISQSAHRRLTQLLNKHPQKLLQIRVDFGGCHGFQYSFALASVSAIPRTEIRNVEGCQLAVDAESLDIVDGAELNWIDTVAQKRFELRGIKRADKGCGCGSSFSLSLE